ncbi:alpha-amylase family glycosyl hydrolase [Crenalkalicoccus roseus]|uniref:alpha-amylase family glycosyl hydrolase n=1 Tax=Crenalkalicoccus roseus TaxID=1485588 RepID=UPI0010804488|nr:alpha-amylase family glycosyl hydrolase [Crenalkalicoccus roseus]
MADLLARKAEGFVLWRPRVTDPPPRLVIGTLRPGNPARFEEHRRLDLRPAAGHPDLWELPAAECGLADGTVYHYWFEVTDSDPRRAAPARMLCTDPAAPVVDWRLLAPRPGPGYGEDDRDPAGVVLFSGGVLAEADPGGERPDWAGDPPLATLPPNNRLVIYELPTTWSVALETEAGVALGIGTFRDVRALVDPEAEPVHFSAVPALEAGRAHLRELGVNALELLPPADSFVDREWGYATSNYFAADYDLGFPQRHASPTASSDLAALVRACHQAGIRFLADQVMAFATRWSCETVNFLDFHVWQGTGDPEEDGREAFGGTLFKYNFRTECYDPVSGARGRHVPARQIMRAHLARWMRDFRLDGIRMDSVVNFRSWDFIQEFKDHARALWRERAAAQGLTGAAAEARFLVVAEELAVPVALVHQNRVDALWNETFKHLLRAALLGEDEGGRGFEETVRSMVDCRRLGFADGAQAVNYVTSHDVEGFRNERLYDFLGNNGVADRERRIRLAFACLLTAVGIPMILAGEEFADQHDLPPVHPAKQVDPVRFDRLEEPWRRRVFDCVARLVRLRTTSPALSVNDTEFLHADFTGERRILAWRRGGPGQDPVVVVANFSDWGTPDPRHPASEYLVPNWPATPPGRSWREVTQAREVPPGWVGREPLYPWEAKVYTTLPA